MRRLFIVLCLTMLGVTPVMAASMAQATPNPPKTQKTLMVLTPAEIAPQRFIAAPPVEGGEVDLADRAAIRRVIAARTPLRLAQAKWDDDHEDPSMYYATIGGGFDLKALPATRALLDVVMNEQSVASSTAKKMFPRKRPWAADATIPTCDPNENPLASYPSGHATMAFSVGVVLATLLPKKAPAIQARAADYAFSREVCGSHYPRDTEASHALGTALALELLYSSALQPKIEAAKEELRRAHFTAD
jgi:acid phosphatase (class A)